jgi:5'-nucleotidase/UDP-sugar diphosphatase
MVIIIKSIKYFLLFLFLSIACSDNNFIDVITTNDMHGSLNDQKALFINPNYPPQIVGAAGLYKYIKNIESESLEKSEDILLLDGGNFFQGHPVGIVDSGKTIIEWMNRLGYDALVPGQNDFLFGYQNLINLSKQANFPFLGANIVDENNEYIFEPYTILEVKGVKIGIIGIVSDAINESVLHNNIKGIKVKSSLKTVKEWIPKLQVMNVDVLAILTSSGVPWDREEVYGKFINKNGKDQLDIDNDFLNAIELGYFSEGVDFIISGGFSKGYNTPWYDNYSHTYIFQNYGNGTGFGHFKLRFNELEKKFI